MPGEDWHPYFRALWEHCRAKPGAREDHPWGDVVFKVHDKVFAFLGHPQRAGVTVKPPPEELDGLLQAPFAARARYIGRYGWISVKVEDDETLELALGLIDDSYDIVSAKAARRKAGGAKGGGAKGGGAKGGGAKGGGAKGGGRG